MSTEITQHQPATHGSVLAIKEEQDFFNPQQIAVLSTLGVRGASTEDLGLFFHQCQKTGLDPFARQIYMIQRAGKQTIQTGIDGFRLIARRAADKRGETISYADTLWADENGNWSDLWLDPKKRPSAAKVVIYRNGQSFPGLAMWSEYGSDQAMWKKIPAHMLAKVAEALALRKAFPQDLSGLYTADEMDQAARTAPAPRDTPQVPQEPTTIRRKAAEEITVTEVVEEPQEATQPVPAPSVQEQWAAIGEWLQHAEPDASEWSQILDRVGKEIGTGRDVFDPADLTYEEADAVLARFAQGGAR